MSSPAACPSDVASLDAILSAMYEVLCGPAGQARDWERFRNLYVAGARLIPVISGPGQKSWARILSVEDYIRRVEPIFEREDFWERETGRQTETFGNVAHVLSSYESLRSPEGEPFDRGMNSVQLFHDGARWGIVSVMWNTSRAE
jgi:hypothetical protein